MGKVVSFIKSWVVGFLLIGGTLIVILGPLYVIQTLFGGIAAGTVSFLLIISPAVAVAGYIIREEWADHQRRKRWG